MPASWGLSMPALPACSWLDSPGTWMEVLWSPLCFKNPQTTLNRTQLQIPRSPNPKTREVSGTREYLRWGRIKQARGAWVAQSVKCPTSAQVMILWFTSSSPASGSVLTARSLESASDSVSPSLSDPPPIHVLSLSVSKIK